MGRKINLIACVSKDLGLGFHNGLLWKIPADQKFFRQTTLNHIVVMGGNTYRSIGRPLPQRKNIVLSRTAVDNPDIVWFDELNKLQDYLQQQTTEIYIIGGASIYETFLRQADRLILTEVNAIKPADVFFPNFPKSNYKREVLQTGEFEGARYEMAVYTKKEENED